MKWWSQKQTVMYTAKTTIFSIFIFVTETKTSTKNHNGSLLDNSKQYSQHYNNSEVSQFLAIIRVGKFLAVHGKTDGKIRAGWQKHGFCH